MIVLVVGTVNKLDQAQKGLVSTYRHIYWGTVAMNFHYILSILILQKRPLFLRLYT